MRYIRDIAIWDISFQYFRKLQDKYFLLSERRTEKHSQEKKELKRNSQVRRDEDGKKIENEIRGKNLKNKGNHLVN